VSSPHLSPPSPPLELIAHLFTYYDFEGKSRSEIFMLSRRTRVHEQLLKAIHRLPIDQQHRYTVSAAEFFTQCHLPTAIEQSHQYRRPLQYLDQDLPTYLPHQRSSFLNCSDFSSIRETISYDAKCYSLFMNGSNSGETTRRMNFDILRDVMINLKYFAWMQINRDYLANGFLLIHPNDSMWIDMESTIQSIIFYLF